MKCNTTCAHRDNDWNCHSTTPFCPIYTPLPQTTEINEHTRCLNTIDKRDKTIKELNAHLNIANKLIEKQETTITAKDNLINNLNNELLNIKNRPTNSHDRLDI